MYTLDNFTHGNIAAEKEASVKKEYLHRNSRIIIAMNFVNSLRWYNHLKDYRTNVKKPEYFDALIRYAETKKE